MTASASASATALHRSWGPGDSSDIVVVLMLALGYGIFCCFLFSFISFISPKLSRRIVQWSKHDRLSWSSRAVSIFHATVMFCRSFYYWNKMNLVMRIPSHIPEFECHTMSIMVGYLLYDSCFEIIWGDGGLIIGHHVAGLISHLLGFWFDSGCSAFYLMMVYLAEISTPFLHCCWLLKQFKINGALMNFCGFILLGTFFAFRVVLSPFLVFHMMTNWYENPIFLYYLNLGISIFFLVMNFYWFYSLVRLIFFKAKSK